MSQMCLKITSDFMGIPQLGARPGGEDQRANFLQHLTSEAPKLASFMTECIFPYCHHADSTSIFYLIVGIIQ